MSYDDLLDKVYEAYYECRKRKRTKKSTIRFSLDYEKELRKLTRELLDRTYDVGESIVFPITRPKHREVFAADFRDRIVHHLIIDEIGDILDNEMIDDSFSCRIGKGTQYGQRRLHEQIIEVSENYTIPTYTLSADVKGFFMSIDKQKCYDMLEKLINDKYEGDREFMCWIVKKVVMNRPEENCIIHGDKRILDNLDDNKTLFRSNGKGFPIGNLTSQIFGNFYLTEFDKWSIEYLGPNSRYCRYVDDIRATSRDKKLLMRYLRDARIWLKENLGIELHWNKWSMQEVHKGIPFIGCVTKPWGIYISNRVVASAFKAVNANSSLDRLVKSMNSYYGFMVHNLTYGIRYRISNAIKARLGDKVTITENRKVSITDNSKNDDNKDNTTHRWVQRNRAKGS